MRGSRDLARSLTTLKARYLAVNFIGLAMIASVFVYAGVVELKDGRLLAFGRGEPMDGWMPMSLSDNLGTTWTYQASPFPPIGTGQRLVLKRLSEGPLLFVSFTTKLLACFRITAYSVIL